MKRFALVRFSPLVLGCCLAHAGLDAPTPRHGRDAGEVIAILPTRPAPVAGQDLAERQRLLRADPTNAELAADVVERLIRLARLDADPRHLGQATAALAPWWDLAQPPAALLTLRGVIRQSLHDFTRAEADLRAATRANPQDGRAWLQLFAVLQTRGEYDVARTLALPLARTAPRLVALTAAATLGSLTGDARRCRDQLLAALDAEPAAPVDQRAWAATSLADMSERLGDIAAADHWYRQALDGSAGEVFVRAAYADFLLDRQRFAEVRSLLATHKEADALLLRLALAEAQGPATRPAAGERTLRRQFRLRLAESGLRGESVHQREEALYQLRLAHDATKALALAQANWQLQREPIDARLLLQAAAAAGQPEAARPVLEWMARTRIEDVRLEAAAQSLPVELRSVGGVAPASIRQASTEAQPSES